MPSRSSIADRLAEHYEELAHHFSQGEEWAKAFEYLVRSGDKARDAYANPAALDCTRGRSRRRGAWPRLSAAPSWPRCTSAGARFLTATST